LPVCGRLGPRVGLSFPLMGCRQLAAEGLDRQRKFRARIPGATAGNSPGIMPWRPGPGSTPRRQPRQPTSAKPKAGRSVTGTAARHAAFVEAYMTNGHNATAAAIAIGCAGTQLANAGWNCCRTRMG
jgi:hypothetical protein